MFICQQCWEEQCRCQHGYGEDTEDSSPRVLGVRRAGVIVPKTWADELDHGCTLPSFTCCDLQRVMGLAVVDPLGPRPGINARIRKKFIVMQKERRAEVPLPLMRCEARDLLLGLVHGHSEPEDVAELARKIAVSGGLDGVKWKNAVSASQTPTSLRCSVDIVETETVSHRARVAAVRTLRLLIGKINS